jgi:hypothetical protein
MTCTYLIDEDAGRVKFLYDGELKFTPGLSFDHFITEKPNLELRQLLAKEKSARNPHDHDTLYCIAWLVARDELVERGLIPE